ncbi:peptide-N(4)-(N-acetyl-beta-glucosaminyl)asparagine amidase-like [Babylonia areolata]|uniref:peptide-N(4)-(N-acetyl-beta- glucosaminyl)asparagine amidase-like n=1 Tax=Babylonia areolata TaxID=304850 RepID=UPI003FCFA85A
MASSESAAQLLLKENSKEDFLAASELLLKLANNVLHNPNEAKYRRIRIANPLLETKLLPVVGGLECLFDMGFQEDGEYLTLPVDSSLIVVRQVRDELSSLRYSLTPATSQGSALTSVPPHTGTESRERSGGAAGIQPSVPPGGAAAPVVAPTMPTVQARPTQTVQDFTTRESVFQQKIRQSMEHVKLYEDPNLQQKARTTIPLDILQQEAEARLHSLQQSGGDSAGVDLKDCLLLELLNWFKKSFFQWVDSLPCDRCGGSTHHAGSTNPTPAERIWGGARVETHRCDTCGEMTRFPRYNHPGKLLETRRGRCGEWANCFTLCCRALGFEARYVLDWSDHVWTEVYSEAQKRWLHCDPCENVCDKPLLYEQGWGKKLTYILAFSKDEVQDVTWRYSAKHAELLTRRTECREAWLVNVLHNIFRTKLQGMEEARKQEMQQRLIVELVELITIKSSVDQHLSGRTTGSLAWRQARGEVGQAADPLKHYYVYRLLEEEKHSEVVHIKYSCAQDMYIRASAHDISTKRWQSCVSSVKSVFRKEESDWKMTYLAREQGSQTGEISWKFDLSGEDLRINKLELKACSAVYENGSVTWRICSDNDCFSVPGAQLGNFKTFELQRRQSLTITAVLNGGRGDNAWQHAQLFRQPLDGSDFPLEIILHLS